jgi:hypothetical protein
MKKILEPLSDKARYIVNRAMADLAKEGYALWGFIFAQQEAAERLTADGRDFFSFEVFNNAGEDSIPAVIAKTESALLVLRSQQPLGVTIADEFQRVINEINKNRPKENQLLFEPHDMPKPQKPN